MEPQVTTALVEVESIEKVIKISRVNKVVKGGKRLAFRAFVIVGDGKGKVGLALGKSKEVPAAIKQGIERAKKSQQAIEMIDGTIPHEVVGRFGSARVMIRPARKGTGVIAGGAVRVLLEALGLNDVVAKSHGSDNAINAAKAAMNGLMNLKNYDEECELRGKKLPVIAYLKRDKQIAQEPKAAENQAAKAAPVEDEKKASAKKKPAAKKAPAKKAAPKTAARTKAAPKKTDKKEAEA